MTLRRNLTLAGSGLLAAAIVAAVALAPWLSPHHPFAPDLSARLVSPRPGHAFGTDEVGRDILSRVLYGARISLLSTLAIIGLAGASGTALGLVSGLGSARLDNLLMRATDLFLAIPPLILALAIGAALGPSLQNVVIAVTLVWWPGYARLARAQVLSIKHELYVEAAHAAGAGYRRIVVGHIFPNSMGPLWAKATTDVAYVLLTISSLGFVGLGPQPPTPELGNMVAAGRGYVPDVWWYSAFPGLAIFLSALVFALFGDALQEVMEPTWRR
ncbi:MAG: ABC transporter permease [Armatimonadetes bacterium]|nr:ABC transporter permease [Armatimonadota bacterium]